MTNIVYKRLLISFYRMIYFVIIFFYWCNSYGYSAAFNTNEAINCTIPTYDDDDNKNATVTDVPSGYYSAPSSLENNI